MTAIIVLVIKASIALSVFAIGLRANFADATFLFRRPSQLAHANFPNEKLAASAVILYLIVSSVLSVVYLKWVKRQELTHPTPQTHNAVKA